MIGFKTSNFIYSGIDQGIYKISIQKNARYENSAFTGLSYANKKIDNNCFAVEIMNKLSQAISKTVSIKKMFFVQFPHLGIL